MARQARSTHFHPLERRAWTLPASVLTVPNALTVLRVLLIPVFLGLYFADEVRLAALVFAIAAGSDLLDGLLARLLHQRSAFGAILDPFADKLLAVASLVALVLHGRLPLWLLGLALVRDGVVVTIAMVARARGIALSASPTRVGKYATFFANLAVIVALIGEISYAPMLSAPVAVVTVIAGECLLVASVQYAWRFALLARAR